MSEEQTPQENQSFGTINTPPVTPPPFQQQPPFGQFGGGMGYQNLPNSTIVLVLGIASIALCCCYGILGLIPAIVALVLSKKDKALYAANPSIYTQSSFKNLNAGRVCAIIGLILNIISILYYAAIIIIFGFGMMNDPQKVQEILKGLQ
ncbi:CCC motif membrane protein [Pedobacter aquatilis]|uniref:CCC motif membrane protein n=1 Tax=Pedobacter aquatilis TaxID=351343 RepID=UPI0025B3A073|nr:CCC motif membrane protein [Pedobacter aquatilis]MDN3585842.1 CCC motif membrane protein [Pedobacter aquatilis]